MAWPLALILIVHRVIFLAFNGAITDDFTAVHTAITRALHGQPLYEQAYNHVDPLYLYSPGATLLLLPLGLGEPFELVRQLFIVINAGAIIIALILLTQLTVGTLRGPVLPVSIALAFATESVTNTLTFSNINGILLLCLVVFYKQFLTGINLNSSRRTPTLVSGGLVLGLAITIKPQFLPILFIPLVRVEWRSSLTALAVPLLTNLLAWPFLPGAGEYITKLGPYLATTRDYANSSLAGWRTYFDISPTLYFPVWLATAAAVAVAIIVLLRWRITDPVLWTFSTASILLTGVFTLSSLGQQYYSMWLFPLFFTCLLPRSIMHCWPAWFAAVLFLIDVSWQSTLWPATGRWLGTFLGTIGWVTLLFVSAATVAGWWAAERKRTRSVD